MPKLIGGKPAARLTEVSDAGQVWSCCFQVATSRRRDPPATRCANDCSRACDRDGFALGIPARMVRTATEEVANPDPGRTRRCLHLIR